MTEDEAAAILRSRHKDPEWVAMRAAVEAVKAEFAAHGRQHSVEEWKSALARHGWNPER